MLIKLAWRNLWRNKLRTSIMLSAMVFGLLGLVSMMSLMTGMTDSMINNAIKWQTSHVQIHHQNYLNDPDINHTLIENQVIQTYLNQQTNIQAWSARFIAHGMIASARSNRGVKINGITPHQEQNLTPLFSHIKQGHWLNDKSRHPILVSTKIAQRLKLQLNSKVVLTFTNTQGDVIGAAFRVHGIFKTPSTPFDENNVFVKKAELQQLAGMTGDHEISILLKGSFNTVTDNHLPLFVDNLQQQIQQPTNLKERPQQGSNRQYNNIQTWSEIQPLLASMISAMATSNTIMLLIFVSAMTFGIVNIMLMSIFERCQELGVLMAVGMPKHQVFLLIMLETCLLGLTGAVIGIISSIIFIHLLTTTGLPLGSMAEGLGAYGVDTVLYPRMSYADYQMIFITVFIASLIAALYPARQILKKRPVDAMAEKH